MSYSTNPHAPRARGNAMRMLILEKKSVQVVANNFGVNRSTIWRWEKKWKEQNSHVQLTNDNRPHRPVGTVFRPSAIRWNIPTITSAPHTHPNRIDNEIVQRIVHLRRRSGRCAEVIHHQITQEGYKVGLSTVKRVLDRYHLTNHWSKWKKRHINTPRPLAIKPGELVEVDTVHYVNKLTGKRIYMTTIIDLYTRMSYVRPSNRILPGEAYEAVMEAEKYFGYKFRTVQTDNGPEFSIWFTKKLQEHDIAHRHTRVHKPNDNAHIERFNRTLREECIGDHYPGRLTREALSNQLLQYLDYYNHHRLHLGLKCKTPIQMLQR